MNIFAELLEARDWLMADGATGTNLFDMGLEAGEAPELWNVTAPEKVRAVNEAAIAAGSDIVLTNSFGGTSARLKLHDAQDRVKELNEKAAKIARQAADAADRPVIVAGSVGPTGELLFPVGTLTEEEATELFADQIEGLLSGGVDVIWLETISSAEEYRAAAAAAARHNAPWCGTMSFDTAGRTMMGVTAADMVALVEAMPNRPLAFGANCGTGASDLLRTVLGFTKAGAEIPIIAKGNAGIPKFVDGHVHYDGTPELMGDYATLARDCGVSIIGGCCGTRGVHLAEMKRRLLSHVPGVVPELATIEAKLGPFSSGDDGSGDAPVPVRQRRRRRG
ncbi:betaine--homocysteine S-methyltransferase [Algicella marina]|uniref:Betaine--homocysteine S-methyltransferase n=1 Tax=Algicella marina TaxID=2683284 RepID=A0A6P1SZ10_9RHOB|nr:betaine--homocysteine S-methyltransferase [Algicella marina]QHQ34850.1 betaine--homocysteine S-methyltransferase [Algicella marina]